MLRLEIQLKKFKYDYISKAFSKHDIEKKDDVYWKKINKNFHK